MSQFTVGKAVELAVQTERDGAEFYSELAKSFADNKEVAEIFTKLASDEKAHEREFTAILNTVSDDTDAATDSNQFYLLQATSISEIFKQGAIKVSGSLSPKDALLTALNFEKATLAHYYALADVLGETQQINRLIKSEKNHISTLMRIILADASFRGLADQW
jgi:rubrerythrin